MTSKIKWNAARNSAMETLINYKEGENVELPVKILDLIDKIPHLTAMSYIEFNQYLCKKVDFIKDINDISYVKENLADGSNDAALISLEGNKNCIILYNDNTAVLTPQRIRFSLAHEIGHFVMKHKISTVMPRNGTNRDYGDYNIKEKEADTFAQNLLMPKRALKKLLTTFYEEYEDKKPDILRYVFDVSNEAFNYAKDEIKNKPWADSTISPAYFKVSNMRVIDSPPVFPVKNFLLNYTVHVCNNCKHVYSTTGDNKNFKYCPVCKTENKIKYKSNNLFFYHENMEENVLNYTSIKIDENSKAIKCPRCNTEANKNENGNLCEICGAFLINKCTGISLDRYDNFKFGKENGEQCTKFENCLLGEKLSGAARYCIYCGCVTTFFAQGLLETYKNELSVIDPFDL